MVLYKRFYPLNKDIGSNNFYCQVGIIGRKYRNAKRIIAIWTIINFTIQKFFNLCAKVILDIFCYYTTNNLEKQINQNDKEITILIATPILITICMHIRSTKFLKKRSFKIEYNDNGAICERYSSLAWRDNCKKKVAKEAMNQDDNKKTSK